ncbi:MAG: histidinol-phosphatase, partial [Desulfobacteraceae bacterium]|nr:histidinol-phosphatase [Desulfobacteraceae bacterium]
VVLGLPEISFTDHLPLPNDFDAVHRMAFHELDDYMKDIERLRKEYPEISIRTGIEADYYEGFEEYLYRTLHEFRFDITILSVHFIKGWPGDNMVFRYSFPGKPIRDVYSDYLSALKKGVETGMFHLVGHLDVIKTEGFPLLETNPEEMEGLLGAIHEKAMAVEINTSGMRKPISHPYPSLDILPHLIRHGIPITTGSDAHEPEQVGFYFPELENHLKQYDGLQFASW